MPKLNTTDLKISMGVLMGKHILKRFLIHTKTDNAGKPGEFRITKELFKHYAQATLAGCHKQHRSVALAFV